MGYLVTGWPSQCADSAATELSLDSLLVEQPASTLFLRCDTTELIDWGIQRNDLIVLNRGADPADGDLVAAIIDGEFTLGQLDMASQPWRLIRPSGVLHLTGDTVMAIEGVVMQSIRMWRKPSDY